MARVGFHKQQVLFRLVQSCFLLGAFLVVIGSGIISQRSDLTLTTLGIFLVVASLTALLNPKKLQWPKMGIG